MTTNVRIEIAALRVFSEWKARFSAKVLEEAKLIALADPGANAVITADHWDAAMKAVLKYAADRYPV